jgi:histidine triad (HIT) family protein
VSDCLFCKIVAGEIPSEKVFENNDFLAFADINPQAPVHILIIPKEHIATIAEVPEEKSLLVGGMVNVANQIAREKGLDSGFRLVFNCQQDAGQEVFHIHLHLLGGRKFTWPPG